MAREVEKQYLNMEEWFIFPEIIQVAGSTISNPLTETDVVVENQILAVPIPATIVEEHQNEIVEEQAVAENVPQENDVVQNAPVLRRSQRERKSAISSDYHVFNTAVEFDLGEESDPTTLNEAMQSENSHKWKLAMEDELLSMSQNGVWTLIDRTMEMKPIGCKWVYKTKRDAEGKIEIYKASLVAKGYNQNEGIDYNETFSPVSTKDAFRVMMALVAHYDLELHQMDVKTTYLNGDLKEDIYMLQPDGFVEDKKKVYKLQSQFMA